MFFSIIKLSLFSLLFIMLIHYLFNFFKNNLTIPKVKDLVNKPNERYNEIIDTLKKNQHLSSSSSSSSTLFSNNHNNNNHNNNNNDVETMATSEMNNELRDFLKDLKKPVMMNNNNNNNMLENTFNPKNTIYSVKELDASNEEGLSKMSFSNY